MKYKWLFVVSTSLSVGRGHLNRSIALAYEISHKINIDFFSNDGGKFNSKEFKEYKNIKFYSKGFEDINLNNYIGVTIDVKKPDKILIKRLSKIKNSAIISDDRQMYHNINTIISPAFEKKNVYFRNKFSLIGKKYYLIPKKYKKYKRRINQNVKNILINFGYLDSKQVTLKILKLLNLTKYNQSVIVLIGNNPSLSKKIKKEKFQFNLKIYSGLSDLRRFYKRVDLCVGAGGIGMIERFLYGIPSISIMTAKDQYYALKNAKKNGATMSLEYENSKKFDHKFYKVFIKLLNNRKRRELLSTKSYKYLDTKGSKRVAKHLLSNY